MVTLKKLRFQMAGAGGSDKGWFRKLEMWFCCGFGSCQVCSLLRSGDYFMAWILGFKKVMVEINPFKNCLSILEGCKEMLGRD